MLSAGRLALIEIELTDAELQQAHELAAARLNDSERRRSPDRPTSRNPTAQVRGACGEIAAAKWLRAEGFEVREGFLVDEDDPDLTADGIGLEVMTAQVAHREITGVCVPPNKLWAARQRGAAAYVFVGTGGEAEPRRVYIQHLCRLEDVDRENTPQPTQVHAHSPAVDNYVIPADRLLDPAEISVLLA